jgi:phosphotransferase family enzyme
MKRTTSAPDPLPSCAGPGAAADHTAVYEALRRIGLIGAKDHPVLTPMTGGVSSDILRVDLPGGPICVKRALPKLRVEADWFAPVERNAAEVDWMRVAASVDPDMVPEILGEDRDTGLFAMRFLDPADHPLWKSQLRDGVIEPATAGRVAARLAAVHRATAGRADVAARFANDATFHAIRLEPYLLATAARHDDCADALRGLAHATASHRLALMHGDISPKNLLIGMRLLWRPGVRSRVLPQPSAAEMPVAAAMAGPLLHLLRCACWDVSRRRRLGGTRNDRSADCAPFAGAVPGPRRWQVAGGILDDRRRPRARPPRCQTASA